jgi:uncharacterized protein YbaA (DUF1428 family)
MTYVDGFLLPIPRKNLAAYRKMAKLASKVWKDHGALQYVEAVGEDMEVPFGLPFPRGLKLKAGEVPVFAWVLYRSKAHRNRVNKAVMADPRLQASMEKKMPFDVKRMMYGGFKTLVEA